MKIISSVLIAAMLTGMSLLPAVAQQGKNATPPKTEAPSAFNRLRIEVTGGDSDKPVENASVYLKTVEQHTIKDKKTEINVKTNQSGIAHIPEAPQGRAEGWKTYGHWYDITDPKQTIKIHLDRPPKWY